jgi:hypothetical protein
MSPYNGFILSIILMLPFAPMRPQDIAKCQDMKLEIKISPSSDQSAIISLSVPRDADIKVFLLAAGDEGPPKEVEAVAGELRDVAKGTYDIIVQDQRRKYCSALQTVTVN